MRYGTVRQYLWLGACLLIGLVGCESPRNAETAAVEPTPAPCDQPMQASSAPEVILNSTNPLAVNEHNLAAGRHLYMHQARPVPCAECHGDEGHGDGPIGLYLSPRPANFSCPDVMEQTPDGQLYWVIRYGSNYLGEAQSPTGIKRPGRRPSGTAMRPHRFYLSEEETWQLVLYLRQLGESS